MLRRIFAIVVFLVTASQVHANDDPLFDVAALTSTPLNPKILKTVERDGIVTEEVQFHSETDGDKEVAIFAYFSYPKGANRLPAYIWNPGGLGQASSGYTEGPARRGYAALCIDFPQPGYRSTGNYPINQGLTLGEDPKAGPHLPRRRCLLKAVTYLETRQEVDRDRIGMAGSSWGGFFTTLMVGIDPRLKVGACFYGTGSLQLGNAWWDGAARNSSNGPTAEERDRWSKTLDPAWRLAHRKTPIAWFTTTNDAFYSMPALMKTASISGGPTHLTLLPNWDHAMPPKFHDAQIQAWLDFHLKGKPPLTKVTAVRVQQEAGSQVARWGFDGQTTSADLIVSYGESGNWRGRFWHTFPAEIVGTTCVAKFPASSLPCFVSGAVIDANGVRTSTPIIQVDPTSASSARVASVPDYNGCQEWGGFEEAHMEFLTRHTQQGQTRWIPKRSDDAKEGKHSAILEPDRTILPPILSTANVPHRFSCFMKAGVPSTITIQLADLKHEFAIGTNWTEAKMELTPANAVMGGISASISIPAEAKVLIDAINFQPIVSESR